MGHSLHRVCFDDDEIDAILMGLYALRDDEIFSEEAETAIAKILEALPARPVTQQLTASSASPRATIESAIAGERKLRIAYCDGKSAATGRIVWPIVVDSEADDAMLAAWCEMRQDFRHFRLDRMTAVTLLPDTYPRPHRLLRIEWLNAQRATGRW